MDLNHGTAILIISYANQRNQTETRRRNSQFPFFVQLILAIAFIRPTLMLDVRNKLTMIAVSTINVPHDRISHLNGNEVTALTGRFKAK